MEVLVHSDKKALGRAAASQGAGIIKAAIAEYGSATIIVATGASQFEMLEHLVATDIDWSKVNAYHLDEYIDLPETHPASFRGYLRDKFISRISMIKSFTEINGTAAHLDEEIRRLNGLIGRERVDLCFAGFGENCHLAFNDPPADFDTQVPYLVVALDQACRQQQFGEGWFATLEDVPARAISMSVQQILKARNIVLSVPDQRKAVAAKAAIEGPISPLYPASILQGHANVTVHLDPCSSSLLSRS